ncbi:MAG: hypothetical protein FRX49_09076 [Trebouxia sp. A1-2]|nr:MAG: hypothetical protein FRX49_09076 [Trebouxia sp. A1-2]
MKSQASPRKSSVTRVTRLFPGNATESTAPAALQSSRGEKAPGIMSLLSQHNTPNQLQWETEEPQLSLRVHVVPYTAVR